MWGNGFDKNVVSVMWCWVYVMLYNMGAPVGGSVNSSPADDDEDEELDDVDVPLNFGKTTTNTIENTNVKMANIVINEMNCW